MKIKREKLKKEDTAHDLEKRYERTINDAPLGRVHLSDLRKHHIQLWIDAENDKTTPATLKRNWTALLAALNKAVDTQMVGKAVEQVWHETSTAAAARLYLCITEVPPRVRQL